MRRRLTQLRLALAVALSLPAAMVAAQETPPGTGFGIKEDRPVTGSNIRRDHISGGALPYDKTYAELTPEQRAIFKSRFVEMGEGDEPPFPVDGLEPLYSAVSRANEAARGGFGKFEMDVFVDETGTTTKVEVIRSPDERLSKYAATIAMLTKFKPALCKGKPCAMGFPFSVTFVRR